MLSCYDITVNWQPFFVVFVTLQRFAITTAAIPPLTATKMAAQVRLRIRSPPLQNRFSRFSQYIILFYCLYALCTSTNDRIVTPTRNSTPKLSPNAGATSNGG